MTRPSACPFEADVLLLADAGTDDAALPPARRLVVEAHMGVCASCAALDDLLDRATTALRAETTPSLAAAEAALARLPAHRTTLVRPIAAVALAAVTVAAVVAALRDRPAEAPSAPRTPTPQDATADDRPGDTPASCLPDGAPPPPAAPEPAPGRAPVADAPDEGPPDGSRSGDVRRAVAAVRAACRDDDPVRVAAVRQVHEAGAVGTLALAELLVSDDPAIVASALRVASSVRSDRLVRSLAVRLADPATADEAARQLGASGSPAAVAALASELTGPARPAVVRSLRDARTPRAFSVLASALRDGAPDPEELLDAAVAIDPAAGARLLLDVAATPDGADAAAAVLRLRARALVVPLGDLARNGDALVAASAVRALGATGSPRAVEALVAASRRHALSRPAIEALVTIGTDAAFAAAFDAASSPRGGRPALDAFDGAVAAAPTLVRTLDAPQIARRQAAVEALGRTGARDAVPDLASALDDPQLRRAAVEALGRIGGDEAAHALARLADRPAADVRLVAALGGTASPVAVAPLATLAREPALSAAAIAGLARIPLPESVLALAELAAQPRTARDARDALRSLPAGLVVPSLLAAADDVVVAPRIHRALVAVAGRDLGRDAGVWSDWWTARQPPPEETEP